MYDMQMKLRNMQVNIEQSKLKNEDLKLIMETELKLRENRD